MSHSYKSNKQLVKFDSPVDFEYVRETAAAYLFRFDDTRCGADELELWVPKSVCQYDEDDGVLEVEKWWADKNDLE